MQRSTPNKPTETQGTVWVTQDSGRINLIPAARWGRIEVLCSSDMPIHRSSADFIDILRNRLQKFNVVTDHVVLVGDPTIIFAVGLILAEKNGGNPRVLKWDRQELCYIPIEIQL